MTTNEILDQILRLEPARRFALVEEILRSLDHPDPEIDKEWLEEAQRRLAEYRAGNTESVSANEVFGNF